jgi:hypothetical protein
MQVRVSQPPRLFFLCHHRLVVSDKRKRVTILAPGLLFRLPSSLFFQAASRDSTKTPSHFYLITVTPLHFPSLYTASAPLLSHQLRITSSSVQLVSALGICIVIRPWISPSPLLFASPLRSRTLLRASLPHSDSRFRLKPCANSTSARLSS